jgi:hypothetical protein
MDSEVRVELESAHELNHHAERLLPALYQCLRDLESPEFQWLGGKKMGKLSKGKLPEAKIQIVFTRAKIYEYGRRTRHIYAVCAHFKNFMTEALPTLKALFDQTRDLDITWNYVYALPLLRLFSNYVKLHLLLNRSAYFLIALCVYRQCLTMLKEQDPYINSVVDFVRDRETMRIVESELASFSDVFLLSFKTLLPFLQVALGAGATFPWKQLSISGAPTTALAQDIFVRPDYLVFMHLSELCEFVLLFAFLFLPVVQNDSTFMDALQMVYANCPVLHVHGTVDVDVKHYLQNVKRTSKIELDVGFLDSDDSNWARQKVSQTYHRRKLAKLLKEFVTAIEIDPSLVCSHYVLALSLMGVARFHLANAFQIRHWKPQREPFQNGDAAELLYNLAQFTSGVLRNAQDIQRFVLYNLREYDGPYLDNLAHSYGMPANVFARIMALVGAFATIDVSEFDSGIDYTLHPCISLVGALVTSLNGYSCQHGITHLTSAMQVLAGCHLRLAMFQDTFRTVLGFCGIQQLWQYRDLLGAMLNDGSDQKSIFNVSALLVSHYFEYDIASCSEVAGLAEDIKTDFEQWSKMLCGALFAWFKGAQEQSGVRSAVEQQEPKMKAAEAALQKVSVTLAEMRKVGIVHIVGEEHDLLSELRSKLGGMLNMLFLRERVIPPIEFEKKIQFARSSFQQVCSSLGLNYSSSVFENLASLSSSTEKLGPIASTYAAEYVRLAREILPVAFFSNTQEIFVAISQQNTQLVSAYLSLPALHALKNSIEVTGCLSIFKSLAATVGQLAKPMVAQLMKVLKGLPNAYDTGVCQFPDPASIIKQIGHISAVLRLREMFRPFAEDAYVRPEFDTDVVRALQDAGAVELMDEPAVIDVFGCLLACPYWESFEYNSGHDAMKDNSHLWGRFFDALVGTSRSVKGRIVPDVFYRQLFARCLLSMHKGREAFSSKTKKAAAYPGLTLLIIVDHIVSESHYADYSQLEQLVAYQLIRSLYTAKLSAIGD